MADRNSGSNAQVVPAGNDRVEKRRRRRRRKEKKKEERTNPKKKGKKAATMQLSADAQTLFAGSLCFTGDRQPFRSSSWEGEQVKSCRSTSWVGGTTEGPQKASQNCLDLGDMFGSALGLVAHRAGVSVDVEDQLIGELVALCRRYIR